MNQDRLDHLLDRYFDEALTREEQTELESLLLSWPQARTLFWKRSRFHALLRRRGREQWGARLALEQAAETPGQTRWKAVGRTWTEWRRPVAWSTLGGIAALALIYVTASWNDPQTSGDAARPEVAETASRSLSGQGIATIVRAVGVQWTGSKRSPGNVLGPGWLKFERGLVELEFHRGARVVVEGPAEFELITDMQARCVRGRLRADVPPPAIGFEILSPNVRVVDRGTAFGLDVQSDGPAEIHVFSGRVDYATKVSPNTERELLQGKAVRVDGAGVFSDIPNVSREFITGEAVEMRANTTMEARYAAWQKVSQDLHEDPTLLVQYNFERDSQGARTLLNQIRNAPRETHGTVIGCSWTEGRWPGKPALDFKQIGDRVRLALPLTHEALTCVSWVRLDALDRPYIAFLMSGDAALGELQWQIRNHGTLTFGKRVEEGWGPGKVRNLESPHVLGLKRCGSWMQIGVVYDAEKDTLTHYLDGQKLNSCPIRSGVPLSTSSLEIGNWSPSGGDPMEPIRAFNGRMDEFLIFSRALSADEIQKLWEIGRPL